MKVIAIAVGYDNLAVRQVGEEFDMPDGSSAPWFKAVEDEAPAKVGKKDKAKAAESDVSDVA